LTVRRQFTGRRDEMPAVRQFVSSALLRDTESYEAARLLVDEAITNPLLHSAACDADRAFQVSIAFEPDLLHVEVRDPGAPFPLRRDGRRIDSVAGRSLELFDELATDWDSTSVPTGHLVWFEVAV
jgi:anti-sigma regulatory factor (Ser/Thr protein kinase)